MIRLYLFILIGFGSWIPLTAQYTNIRVNPIQELPSEPSIAIHPKNTNEIAIGAVLNHYYYSANNGASWQSAELNSPFGVYGDPVLTFDALGRLYYFHLSDYPKGAWIDRIVCQYNDNMQNPLAFSKGTFPIPNGKKAQDKHWVDIDPVTNHIYLTWTQFDTYDSKNVLDSSRIMFSKSIDRGLTWSTPKSLSFFAGDCLDDDKTVEGAIPLVGKNGKVYVVWANAKGLVFQRSDDGGDTWLKVEKTLWPQVGGWEHKIPGIYRCNGLPNFQIDRSGKASDGTLYLSWADQINGSKNTDVWVAKSSDQGETWSAPKKVNQDQTVSHQFMPAMTLDQSNGDLHWVFYDRSKHPSKSLLTDVVWVSSHDGGLQFEQKTISEKPFAPQSVVFFGDYIAIAARDGKVHPVWVRMDMGKTSLWTTAIDSAP